MKNFQNAKRGKLPIHFSKRKSAKSACVFFFWLRTRRRARDRDSYTYIITNITKKVEKQKRTQEKNSTRVKSIHIVAKKT